LWEATKPLIPSPFIGKSLADAAAFLQIAPENENWRGMYQVYFAFLDHEFETTGLAKVCQIGDGDGEGEGLLVVPVKRAGNLLGGAGNRATIKDGRRGDKL